jgi:hypothetical protein
MKKEEVKIGDRLVAFDWSPQPLYGIWKVLEIQSRGVVVVLRNGSHKHLMEWSRVEQMKKL